MKSNIVFLCFGIIIGLVIFYAYNRIFPSAIPIGDSGYLVKGKYFIFDNPESGIRILEKTNHGIASKVFIPGASVNEGLMNEVGAQTLELEPGNIVQTKRISYDEDSFNVETNIYRYEEGKLIKIPYVTK